MASTLIPLHELVGDNGPALVLDLMAGLVGAAVARNVDVVHPSEVVIGRGARVNLQIHRDLPPHPLTSAPELRHKGTNAATLVYAIGALGALAALGQVAPAPIDDQAHPQWLRDLRKRLVNRWGDGHGTEAAIALIIACLDRDPATRPAPQEVIQRVRAVGFPSEQGLVSRTGFAPPSLEDQLPVEVTLRSQGMQWPPILSVVPDIPRGAIQRPRVKIRPPRNAKGRRWLRPDMRWAAFCGGVVLALVLLALGARMLVPSVPSEQPDPPAVHPGG